MFRLPHDHFGLCSFGNIASMTTCLRLPLHEALLLSKSCVPSTSWRFICAVLSLIRKNPRCASEMSSKMKTFQWPLRTQCCHICSALSPILLCPYLSLHFACPCAQEGQRWADLSWSTHGLIIPVMSHNVHELRGYNRLAGMARGKYMILVQVGYHEGPRQRG